MNRSRLRIVVVAVLIAVVVAPSLASASSLGLSHPSGSVLQQALAPLARAWGWLSGIRPDSGCSSDPMGGNCLPAKVRPQPGCSSDPNGGHCNPADTPKAAFWAPRRL
jgi:hypothetical protein